MGKVRYYAIRSLQTVFLLWFVITFLFLLFRLVPGDFTTIMAGTGASPEAVEAVRERYNLNDPLYIQYWAYLSNFLHLDIGRSIQHQLPVWEYVRMRIFNTFILAAPAITFGYLVGSGIGAYVGAHRDTKLEKIAVSLVILSGSFPSFFLAIVLIVIFASGLGWFPTSGMVTPQVRIENSWWEIYLTKDFLVHYILPFSAVAIRYLITPTLIMRTNVVEVGGQNFMNYHRITGLPQIRQLIHLARHASLPVITVYPVSLARAFGGLVLIETIFNWPGMGWALVQAVMYRDFAVVQFIFFIVAAFVIIANFGVDILYGIIDPRISIADEGATEG